MSDLDVIIRGGIRTAVPREYAGKIIQIFPPTFDATQKSTSTSFPQDDTIPQSGEGTAYSELDTTVTPKFASSRLRVEVRLAGFSASALRGQMALFRDSGANALATVDEYCFQNSITMTLDYEVVAGSTAATTFKIRFGRSSGTFYLNDFTTALYGGTVRSSMVITEIAG
ncbi:MAG: hypothetical protein ABL994_16860 [Verrucomicrobiales bacterium]